jgi:sulfide dehydrogenase cytochrome subunit
MRRPPGAGAALLALLLAAGITMPAFAADPSVGRLVAATCANCHGTDGRSRGDIPALAGRDQAELVRLVRDFRDGKRRSTVMQQLAKGYSDADIEAAAAYFAAQKAN